MIISISSECHKNKYKNWSFYYFHQLIHVDAVVFLMCCILVKYVHFDDRECLRFILNTFLTILYL